MAYALLTSWVITAILFIVWTAIITTMIYIFKISVRRFDLGTPEKIVLLILMMVLLMVLLLIPVRICQIAFDAVVN